MKKRILSAVLVSGVTLGAATTVNAENLDAKIDAQNSVISNLTAEQAAAQSKVQALQSQLGSLQKQQSSLEEENSQLEAKSKKLSEEIQALSSKIIARKEVLEKQIRSAQKGTATSTYINTLLNSETISEVVNNIVAINGVVNANAKMLSQQKADKASLEEKQRANQEAINKVASNLQAIAANKFSLETQQADLEVAKLDLSAQMATAESEKSRLQSQKAEAERIAAEKAAAEAAAKERAAAEAKAQTESLAQAQARVATVAQAPQASEAPIATFVPAPVAQTAPQTVSAPAASAVITPTYSSANTYPVGQCTWGAKALAPWAGNNWGNGGQWAYSAKAAGFPVGSRPVPGAIAVWNDGGYGHVAVVVEVKDDSTIRVMESNFNGKQYIDDHRGWFNPGAVSYIYPR